MIAFFPMSVEIIDRNYLIHVPLEAVTRSDFKVRTAYPTTEMLSNPNFPTVGYTPYAIIVDLESVICSFLPLRYCLNCKAIQRSVRCYGYTQMHYTLSLAAEMLM